MSSEISSASSNIRGGEMAIFDDYDDESLPSLRGLSFSSSCDGMELRDSSSFSSSDEDGSDKEIETSILVLANSQGNPKSICHPFETASSFDSKYYGISPAASFKVRGHNYLKDKKKIQSGPAFFELITADLVEAEKPLFSGICNHPDEYATKFLNSKDAPAFLFCVNIFVPPRYHLVLYYAVPSLDLLADTTQPFGALAKPFFFGDCDKYRDNTFKLIPRIVNGNFLVKRAVGSKPTLLGRKIKLHYVRGERFMELIMDIGSDPIAENIVQLAKGFAKSLVVDMAFVLEGKCHMTLPENIMATARLSNIDFKQKLRTIKAPP